MREYDNSKIHKSSNSLLSICLLIMLDTLLLVPSEGSVSKDFLIFNILVLGIEAEKYLLYLNGKVHHTSGSR